jgi:hypothetical protein
MPSAGSLISWTAGRCRSVTSHGRTTGMPRRQPHPPSGLPRTHHHRGNHRGPATDRPDAAQELGSIPIRLSVRLRIAAPASQSSSPIPFAVAVQLRRHSTCHRLNLCDGDEASDQEVRIWIPAPMRSECQTARELAGHHPQGPACPQPSAGQLHLQATTRESDGAEPPSRPKAGLQARSLAYRGRRAASRRCCRPRHGGASSAQAEVSSAVRFLSV